MSAKNDKYRNPPALLGYVQQKKPDLVFKENGIAQGLDNEKIIDMAICNEPDEKFVINSSSGDEEIPVESSPMMTEVIDMDEDVVPMTDKLKDILVTIKTSEESPSCSEIFKDLEKGSDLAPATDPVEMPVREPKPQKNEKIPLEKRKKNDQGYEQKSHSKKIQARRDTYDRDNDSKSTLDSYRTSPSCKTRPKRTSCYSSDDSDCSSRKTAKRQCTPPSSSKRYHTYEYDEILPDVKQKVKPSAMLYGVYHCKVCNVSMNSLPTYQNHINGKRHQKALDAQNVDESAAKTFIPTEVTSKCPKPPPGYYRKKLNQVAKIQPLLDKNLKTPCPGLHKVIELHGVTETSYYCSLCDSHCSANSLLPHLSGFKHQLSCVKHFRIDLYEKWSYKQKCQIEQAIRDEMSHIERKYGRGLVRVEKDFSVDDNRYVEMETTSVTSCSEKPSTSRQSSAFSDYSRASIPDPSKPGYYCRICDSHSNSLSMWQSHIVGKRHITNVKKAPGTAPSKSKYTPAPSARAYILDDLNDIDAPVVGLSQIREIRKSEIGAVTYNCFLCSACLTDLNIIDHILSRKHREKYLDSINHPELKTLRSIEMKESSKNSIIEEICASAEAEMGCGTPEVYFTKCKMQYSRDNF